MRACYLEILVVALSVATVQAAKILMMPGNANSHTLMFANLGKELSEVGNKVHFLMPSNNKMGDLITVSDNFTIIRYQVDDETPFASSREFSETVVEVALASSTWTKMRLWSQMEVRYNLFYAKECESLMENKALIWNLKNGGFQFVIIDPWIVPGCNFLIPKSWESHTECSHSQSRGTPISPGFRDYRSPFHSLEWTSRTKYRSSRDR